MKTILNVKFNSNLMMIRKSSNVDMCAFCFAVSRLSLRFHNYSEKILIIDQVRIKYTFRRFYFDFALLINLMTLYRVYQMIDWSKVSQNVCSVINICSVFYPRFFDLDIKHQIQPFQQHFTASTT
ncbi:CLUMA_CG021066, isoform A [Clunio marinus]|uniref:CLUMA_CG021066, isoform A n=1 Tax=Clunio marinus TaxID=568069 RepID=A0A1J1J6J9_9DIPT|nr:CLUMA_CG021066, isoform A [Clunio marinus]